MAPFFGGANSSGGDAYAQLQERGLLLDRDGRLLRTGSDQAALFE
jgi:hypothetical protein